MFVLEVRKVGMDGLEVIDVSQQYSRPSEPVEDDEKDSVKTNAVADDRDFAGVVKGKMKYDREFLMSIGQRKGINEFKVAERGLPELARDLNTGYPIKRQAAPKGKKVYFPELPMDNKEVELHKAQNPWKPGVLKRRPLSEHTDEEGVARRTRISQASKFPTGVKMAEPPRSGLTVFGPPSHTGFGGQRNQPGPSGSSLMKPLSNEMPNLLPNLLNKFQSLSMDFDKPSNKGNSSKDFGRYGKDQPTMFAPQVGPASIHSVTSPSPSVTFSAEHFGPVSSNDKQKCTADTKTNAKCVSKEYFLSKMFDNTMSWATKLFPGQQTHDFIDEISRQVVQMSKEAEQKRAGSLVRLLIKNGVIEKDAAIKLMAQGVMAELPDILRDAPMATTYLAGFLVEIFFEENSLDWLVQIGNKLMRKDSVGGATWRQLAVNSLNLLKLRSNEENVLALFKKTESRYVIPIHEMAKSAIELKNTMANHQKDNEAVGGEKVEKVNFQRLWTIKNFAQISQNAELLKAQKLKLQTSQVAHTTCTWFLGLGIGMKSGKPALFLYCELSDMKARPGVSVAASLEIELLHPVGDSHKFFKATQTFGIRQRMESNHIWKQDLPKWTFPDGSLKLMIKVPMMQRSSTHKQVHERGLPELARGNNIGNPIRRPFVTFDEPIKSKAVELHKADSPGRPGILKRKALYVLKTLTPSGFKFLELPFEDKDERISPPPMFQHMSTHTQVTVKSIQEKALSSRSLNAMRNNMLALLADEKSWDVNIITRDGVKLSGHKFVLRMHYPVFASMLRSGLSASKTDIIKVDDVSGKTMGIILRYLYTGDLLPSWSDADVIVELTHAAGKYQLTEVLKFLDDTLGNDMTDEHNLCIMPLLKLVSKLSLKNAEERLLEKFYQVATKAKTAQELFVVVAGEGNNYNVVTSDAKEKRNQRILD